MLPEKGHPVIHQRGIEFPKVQVRMALIAPADEMLQLPAIAVLGLLRPRAGALLQETLQEELVPPENGTGLGGIDKAADVRQGLRFVQPGKNGRELVRKFVGKEFLGL